MNREEIIIPLITGKKVLDCGGVDHWATELKQSRGDWLHGIIAKHAASCLGVDILEDNVNEINLTGKYKFKVTNVESLPFEHEFDVVVAGDIVEHIYNMGLFLDSVWKALRGNGVFIITTPNSYSLSLILKAMLSGKEHCHPEHTCYYSQQTLSYVVEKHGFSIESFYILPRPAKSRIIFFFRGLVSRIRPNLAEKLVLVAHKLPAQSKYVKKW